MSDSVVFNRFLNNTCMSASYRRATRLAGWNKKPSESSVRRVLNHTLQRTGDIALLSSLRLVAVVAELGSLVVIATVPNTGTYKDFIGVRGGNARYIYKICEAATQNCSNEVTVRFGGPPL